MLSRLNVIFSACPAVPNTVRDVSYDIMYVYHNSIFHGVINFQDKNYFQLTR